MESIQERNPKEMPVSREEEQPGKEDSVFDEDGLPRGINQFLGRDTKLDSFIRGMAKPNLLWMLKTCSRGNGSLSPVDKYASLELWYFALQIFNPEAANVFVVPSSCLGNSKSNKYFDNMSVYSHTIVPDQVPIGESSYPSKFKVFLIPVLANDHISVMAFSVADKTFYCYDSLAGEEFHTHELYCSIAYELTQQKCLGEYETSPDGSPVFSAGLFGNLDDCNIEMVTDGLPQQTDRWSCGFYALAFSLLVIRSVARDKGEPLGKLISDEMAGLSTSFHQFVETLRVYLFDVMIRTESLYSNTIAPLVNLDTESEEFANLSCNFLVHRISTSDVLLVYSRKKLTAVVMIYLLQRYYGLSLAREYLYGSSEPRTLKCLFLRVDRSENLKTALESDLNIRDKLSDRSFVSVTFVETGNQLSDVPIFVLRVGTWKKVVVPYCSSEYRQCISQVIEYFSCDSTADTLVYYDASKDDSHEVELLSDPFFCQFVAFCGLKTFLDAVVATFDATKPLYSVDTLENWFEYSFNTAVIRAFIPKSVSDIINVSRQKSAFKRNATLCAGRFTTVLNSHVVRILFDSAISGYTFLPVTVMPQSLGTHAKIKIFFSRAPAISDLEKLHTCPPNDVDSSRKGLLGKRVGFSKSKPNRKSRKISRKRSTHPSTESSPDTDGSSETPEPFLAMMSLHSLVFPDRMCRSSDSKSGTHYSFHVRPNFVNSDPHLSISGRESHLMMRTAAFLNFLELQNPLVGDSCHSLTVNKHRGIVSPVSSTIKSHSIQPGGWLYYTIDYGVRRKGERQCFFHFPWKTFPSVSQDPDKKM